MPSTPLFLQSLDYDYVVYDETQYMKGLAHSRHIFKKMFFLLSSDAPSLYAYIQWLGTTL